MSNLVTFEQAKMLKELGYREQVTAYYVDGSLDYNSPINWNTNEGLDENGEYQEEDEYCSAPTVSSVLDWVREEKRIECGVIPICEYFAKDNKDGSLSMSSSFVGYDYSFFDKSNDKGEIVNIATFSTHPLAESALLTTVLNYLIEKEK